MGLMSTCWDTGIYGTVHDRWWGFCFLISIACEHFIFYLTIARSSLSQKGFELSSQPGVGGDGISQ